MNTLKFRLWPQRFKKFCITNQSNAGKVVAGSTRRQWQTIRIQR